MIKTFHNPLMQQVTFADQRHYTNDGGKTWVPSVTEILSVYPKGFGFDQWLKDVGAAANEIRDRAAKQGTAVHDATEMLHKGQTVEWADEEGREQYSLREWQMILKYQEFWQRCEPVLVCNEFPMVSPKLGYGGTIDRIIDLADSRWLLDIKTGNSIHTSQFLQLAAYAYMWNEANPKKPIEKVGILHLNAYTRTKKIEVKTDTYQGEGWQLKKPDIDYHQLFAMFKHVQAIYTNENPIAKPLNLIYPDNIQPL